MNKKTSTYVVLFTVAICAVFGAGVSAVDVLTRNMTASNQTLHRNRILAQAFGLSVEGTSAESYAKAVSNQLSADTVGVYEVFRHKNSGAVGFLFSGLGFWDRITGILVLSSDLSKVKNLKILEQKETPGLGARIEEKWFTDQFRNLTIKWNSDSPVLVGSGAAGAPNRVDAITGATQTSIAMQNILNDQLPSFRTALRDMPGGTQ